MDTAVAEQNQTLLQRKRLLYFLAAKSAVKTTRTILHHSRSLLPPMFYDAILKRPGTFLQRTRHACNRLETTHRFQTCSIPQGSQQTDKLGRQRYVHYCSVFVFFWVENPQTRRVRFFFVDFGARPPPPASVGSIPHRPLSCDA